MAEAITVVLCEDHVMVRIGLRRLLEDHADIRVVGEAGDAETAVTIAGLQRPDVMVMDIGLQGTNGVEGTRMVRVASPRTRVLVLTAHDDVAYLRRAFEAGAAGYLVKDAADLELVLAVREVAAGREYVDSSLGAALLSPPARVVRPSGPGGQLSERELDVLRLIALGETNAEIAKALFVSVRTVETHRAHLHQKLGLKARSELVAYAREIGLLGLADGP